MTGVCKKKKKKNQQLLSFISNNNKNGFSSHYMCELHFDEDNDEKSTKNTLNLCGVVPYLYTRIRLYVFFSNLRGNGTLVHTFCAVLLAR